MKSSISAIRAFGMRRLECCLPVAMMMAVALVATEQAEAICGDGTLDSETEECDIASPYCLQPGDKIKEGSSVWQDAGDQALCKLTDYQSGLVVGGVSPEPSLYKAETACTDGRGFLDSDKKYCKASDWTGVTCGNERSFPFTTAVLMWANSCAAGGNDPAPVGSRRPGLNEMMENAFSRHVSQLAAGQNPVTGILDHDWAAFVLAERLGGIGYKSPVILNLPPRLLGGMLLELPSFKVVSVGDPLNGFVKVFESATGKSARGEPGLLTTASILTPDALEVAGAKYEFGHYAGNGVKFLTSIQDETGQENYTYANGLLTSISRQLPGGRTYFITFRYDDAHGIPWLAGVPLIYQIEYKLDNDITTQTVTRSATLDGKVKFVLESQAAALEGPLSLLTVSGEFEGMVAAAAYGLIDPSPSILAHEAVGYFQAGAAGLVTRFITLLPTTIVRTITGPRRSANEKVTFVRNWLGPNVKAIDGSGSAPLQSARCGGVGQPACSIGVAGKLSFPFMHPAVHSFTYELNGVLQAAQTWSPRGGRNVRKGADNISSSILAVLGQSPDAMEGWPADTHQSFTLSSTNKWAAIFTKTHEGSVEGINRNPTYSKLTSYIIDRGETVYYQTCSGPMREIGRLGFIGPMLQEFWRQGPAETVLHLEQRCMANNADLALPAECSDNLSNGIVYEYSRGPSNNAPFWFLKGSYPRLLGQSKMGSQLEQTWNERGLFPIAFSVTSGLPDNRVAAVLTSVNYDSASRPTTIRNLLTDDTVTITPDSSVADVVQRIRVAYTNGSVLDIAGVGTFDRVKGYYPDNLAELKMGASGIL